MYLWRPLVQGVTDRRMAARSVSRCIARARWYMTIQKRGRADISRVHSIS